MAEAEIIAAEEPQIPRTGGRYILQSGRENDSSFADGFSHHYIEYKAEKLGKSEAESKPIDMESESEKYTIFKTISGFFSWIFSWIINGSLKEPELNTTRQEM